jgi:hypothetical protein
VDEFIAGLNYVPYQAVHKSLKTALDYVLRDRALTMEARAMGLENDKEVRLKTELYTQNRLQLAMRWQLVANLSVEDVDMQRYFDVHYASKYPDMKFADAKELIKSQVLNEKRSRAVTEHVQQLRHSAAVNKYVEPIHAWYDARRAGTDHPASQ